MKTLQQILKKKHELRSQIDFEIGNVGSDLFPSRLTDADIIEAVRLWLQQKLDEEDVYNETRSDVFHELLGEFV